MILAEKYFGCHVARRPTGITRVKRLPDSRIAEVNESQVAIFIEDQVLRANIPMHDTVRVHEFKRLQDACYNELSLGLVKPFPFVVDVVGEVTASVILRHQI